MQTHRSDLAQSVQEFSNTYSYDILNGLTRCVDNVGNTNRYDYDSPDRRLQKIDPTISRAFFTSDLLGRCTLAVADLNRDGIADLTVDVYQPWTYDDNSRLVPSTDDNTNTTFYAYDSLDREVNAQPRERPPAARPAPFGGRFGPAWSAYTAGVHSEGPQGD